jgi:2-methylisocitrate lyase-like PEP mutase family enzyme
MKPSSRFRQLLAQPGLIVAPGAYDGLSAKLIEQAGFDVVYATGAVSPGAVAIPTSDCSP